MSSELESATHTAVESSEAAQKAHMLFLTAWYETIGTGMGAADVTKWLGCTTEHLQELLIGKTKPTVEEVILIAEELGVDLSSWF